MTVSVMTTAKKYERRESMSSKGLFLSFKHLFFVLHYFFYLDVAASHFVYELGLSGRLATGSPPHTLN